MSALRVLLWLFCCKGFYRSCDFGLEILGKLAVSSGVGEVVVSLGGMWGFLRKRCQSRLALCGQ